MTSENSLDERSVLKDEVLTETMRSLTPNLQSNEKARAFLQILDGVPYKLYRSMCNEIWEQRGNPQEQVDWATPEQWIPERLCGEEQKLAIKLWQQSKNTINPRHVRGLWYFAKKHNLFATDGSGILTITDRGQCFIDQPAGQLVAEIDSHEGLLTILQLVAEKGPGKRGSILPGYAEFCRTYTTCRSDSVLKGSLYDRLSNLIVREYIDRKGQSYEVTDSGLAYLEAYAALVPGPDPVTQTQTGIRRLAKEMRQEAREQLAEYLVNMDPFKFEELVKLLLEEMGYDNVDTTSPTHDKGVDVVANIELGISSVREVVQVKRHRSNINRTVLDQLRGSLHRFDAVRGTIITTGRFSKGAQDAAFESGAAPITLIDGDKLLDLLVENEIGISKKAVEYLEFDPDKLTQFESDDAGPENEM